jgi:hypothetical protein
MSSAGHPGASIWRSWGGDGTLNACASALVETGLPLGILPLGTGNDLARTLAIPTALEAAADVIVAGRQMHIDVGEVNGVPFLNVASIGMSVQLAEELTADVKRRFGALGYLVAAMRTLRKARSFRASIASPAGQVHVRTLQIAVGNGRHYGAGMTVAAHARIDDQLLDLYSIETSRIWRIALMARALAQRPTYRVAGGASRAGRQLPGGHEPSHARQCRRRTADEHAGAVHTPPVGARRVRPRAIPRLKSMTQCCIIPRFGAPRCRLLAASKKTCDTGDAGVDARTGVVPGRLASAIGRPDKARGVQRRWLGRFRGRERSRSGAGR